MYFQSLVSGTDLVRKWKALIHALISFWPAYLTSEKLIHFSGKFICSLLIRTTTFGANKQVRIFPQAKNATFWLDEVAKIWFLQTHTLPWLRSRDEDSASGTEVASAGAREINTRDRKWTESEKNRCGLQLAEKLPESLHDHPSYRTKTTWSPLLPSSALSNWNYSQQVKILCSLLWYFATVESKFLIQLDWKLYSIM